MIHGIFFREPRENVLWPILAIQSATVITASVDYGAIIAALIGGVFTVANGFLTVWLANSIAKQRTSSDPRTADRDTPGDHSDRSSRRPGDKRHEHHDAD